VPPGGDAIRSESRGVRSEQQVRRRCETTSLIQPPAPTFEYKAVQCDGRDKRRDNNGGRRLQYVREHEPVDETTVDTPRDGRLCHGRNDLRLRCHLTRARVRPAFKSDDYL